MGKGKSSPSAAARRAAGHRFTSPAIERRLDTVLVGGPFDGMRVRMPFVKGSQDSKDHMRQEVHIKEREVTGCKFGLVLAKVVGIARYVFFVDTIAGPRHRFAGYLEEKQ